MKRIILVGIALVLFVVVALLIVRCNAPHETIPDAPITAAPVPPTNTPTPTATLTSTPTSTPTLLPPTVTPVTPTLTPIPPTETPTVTPTLPPITPGRDTLPPMDSDTKGDNPILPVTGGQPPITPDLLSALLGILFSLILSYLPGVRERYDALKPNYKRMYAGLGIVAIGFGVGIMSCAQWADWVICDRPGLMGLASNIIWALMSNQATFMISPKVPTGEEQAEA